MKLKVITLSMLLLTVGCASNRNGHEKMRQAAKAKEFDKAFEIVKGDDFFKDENSKLVKLMEEALLLHMKGDYYQAMMMLDQAKELSDQLFTVSASKKVAAAVINDNADNYYGEAYERSMIRFYQALNHYMLSLKGEYEAYSVEEKNKDGAIHKRPVAMKKLNSQEMRFHLTAARSTLLEWNALLENYKAETAGKAVYKDDLLAKIFGAFIHEKIGTTTDKEIALGLYKEAKGVLLRNYSMLPTYNKKSSEFAKNFSNFATMEESEVVKNFIEKTPHYVNLEKFIDEQIARVSSNKNSNTVFVLIENDFIAPKVAKKFDFTIPTGTAPASAGNAGDFMKFTANILKAGEGMKPKIYFEMPEIPYAPAVENQSIIVKDLNGKVVATKKLSTINPLSELANYTLKDKALGNYAKVGGRVMAKHVAALLVSYEIYKKQPGAVGTLMATGSYTAANKGIEASERADLRSWSLLPHMYSSTSFDLSPGRYIAEYHRGDRIETLGEVEVKKDSGNTLLHRRLYN